MIHRDKGVLAVIAVTCYLILYCILLQFRNTETIAIGMFACSPFLMMWMVYRVLKFGRHNGKTLGNEEFGYQDKNKNDLGIF